MYHTRFIYKICKRITICKAQVRLDTSETRLKCGRTSQSYLNGQKDLRPVGGELYELPEMRRGTAIRAQGARARRVRYLAKGKGDSNHPLDSNRSVIYREACQFYDGLFWIQGQMFCLLGSSLTL